MHRKARAVVIASCALMVGAGLVRAEQPKMAVPAMDPAKQAAMEAMQRLGSPSEAHAVLKPLAGTWTYTGEFQMSPEEAPEVMTGTTTNTLIFGGRFLRQETAGQMKDMPPFEGVGILGYDNVRKEYQSVWYDNMNTALMTGAGQYDPAAKALTLQGEFSCPMTGEAHRAFRDVWTIVDQDHTTYQSYMRTPEGREFKAMEIRYTRAQ